MIQCALQPDVEDEFKRTFDMVAETLKNLGCDVNVRDTDLVASLPYVRLDEGTIGGFSEAFGSERLTEFLMETVEGALRDTFANIVENNLDVVGRHLAGRNPGDLSIDGMRAVLDAMNDELEYDWDDYAPLSSLVIRCGYGVRKEGRFSVPEGVAIHIDIADDEACGMPPYEGYFLMRSARTDADCPEDVTLDDAKETCGRFLERMRLQDVDTEREKMAP